MKKSLFTIAIMSMLLTGCVVVPRHAYYVAPGPVVVGTTVTTAAVVTYEEGVYYPEVATAYVWDPVVGCYFFIGPGGRHYMSRGWAYHTHGVPRGGYYHRH